MKKRNNYAIAYYGNSLDTQNKVSIEYQKQLIHEEAIKMGLTINKEYEDIDLETASQLHDMISESDNLKPTVVLICNIDAIKDKINCVLANKNINAEDYDIVYVDIPLHCTSLEKEYSYERGIRNNKTSSSKKTNSSLPENSKNKTGSNENQNNILNRRIPDMTGIIDKEEQEKDTSDDFEF